MDNPDTNRQAGDRRAAGRRKNRRRDHSRARNKGNKDRTNIRTDSIRANPSNTASPNPILGPNPSPILPNPNPNHVRASPSRRGSRFRESCGRTLHREILPLREIPILRGTRCHETRCRRGIPFRLGSHSRREIRRHR